MLGGWAMSRERRGFHSQFYSSDLIFFSRGRKLMATENEIHQLVGAREAEGEEPR